jgi:hypothetical protein
VAIMFFTHLVNIVRRPQKHFGIYHYHNIDRDEPIPITDNENDEHNPETNRLALAQNMTPEAFARVEKSLIRKLDIYLLTCVWLIFILNYLDRVRSFPRLP